MKKTIIFTALIVALFGFQRQSLYADVEIDWERLGTCTGSYVGEFRWFYGGGLYKVDEIYFEHGSIIKTYHNGTITTEVAYNYDGYPYGHAKRIANGFLNVDNLVLSKTTQIYIYNSDLREPIKCVKLESKNNYIKAVIKELNLDADIPYILVFCDNSNNVLTVRKIVL